MIAPTSGYTNVSPFNYPTYLGDATVQAARPTASVFMIEGTQSLLPTAHTKEIKSSSPDLLQQTIFTQAPRRQMARNAPSPVAPAQTTGSMPPAGNQRVCNVSECFSVLQRVAECRRVLQSIAEEIESCFLFGTCFRNRCVTCLFLDHPTSIVRNPPPRGVALFGWFPNEQPGGRGPLLKKNPIFGGKLGLFFRGVLETTEKENIPGRGFSFDHLI